jgi:uncharacterized protein GlcG (DUF336 family)
MAGQDGKNPTRNFYENLNWNNSCGSNGRRCEQPRASGGEKITQPRRRKKSAKKNNAPGGVIAVVDEGGNLMALERLDGTFATGATISIGKARTAVLFKKPTRFFEELINKGRTAMTAVDGFTPLIGGIPIIIDGQVVGGVGVSGAASANQDEELALAGANALMGGAAKTENPTSSNAKDSSMQTAQAAIFIDSKKVATAFAKGMPLLETGGYKVHASRRVEPGQAEIHTLDTDVIYVVDGSATLVRGGKAIDTKTIAPMKSGAAKSRAGRSIRSLKATPLSFPTASHINSRQLPANCTTSFVNRPRLPPQVSFHSAN